MMSYNNVTWRCRVNWLHTRGGGAGSTGYTLMASVLIDLVPNRKYQIGSTK